MGTHMLSAQAWRGAKPIEESVLNAVVNGVSSPTISFILLALPVHGKIINKSKEGNYQRVHDFGPLFIVDPGLHW